MRPRQDQAIAMLPAFASSAAEIAEARMTKVNRSSQALHLSSASWLLAVLLLVSPGCDSTDQPATAPVGEDSSVDLANLPPDVPSDTAIRFEDVAAEWGVNFTPTNGKEAGHYTILESLGSGVAICDFDNDGRPDIVLPGGGTFDANGQPIGTPTGIFRQHRPSQFADTSDDCGIHSHGAYTHGVVFGDWNNDGFEDAVITGYQTVLLFRNNGDGTFEDVTEQSGIEHDHWATSAAFLDADGDGNLELFVVNYVDWWPDTDRRCIVKGHRDVCPPGEFEAAADSLYFNNADGTFSEQAEHRGIDEKGKGLAAIAGDIDLDGDTDLYVANDTTANLLYLNDGNGHFTESGLISGCALGATLEAEGSMGAEFADFNSDGLPDIWVSNYENQSFAMYQSRGPGIFQHVSGVTGITAVGQLYVGFGTVAFDADLDGDEDIFAGNGHVMYESGAGPATQQPLIYENIEGRLFRNIANLTGNYGRSVHMARGVACGDMDGDGLPDLVVSHMNEPVAILQNQSIRQGNSLQLRLKGRIGNRSAIGATIRGPNGRALRLRISGGSYLSDSYASFTWGIDDADYPKDITVTWPDGTESTHPVSGEGGNLAVEPLANQSRSGYPSGFAN